MQSCIPMTLPFVNSQLGTCTIERILSSYKKDEYFGYSLLANLKSISIFGLTVVCICVHIHVQCMYTFAQGRRKQIFCGLAKMVGSGCISDHKQREWVLKLEPVTHI